MGSPAPTSQTLVRPDDVHSADLDFHLIRWAPLFRYLSFDVGTKRPPEIHSSLCHSALVNMHALADLRRLCDTRSVIACSVSLNRFL